MLAQSAVLEQRQTSNCNRSGRRLGDGARVLRETLNYLEPRITIFNAQLQLIFANWRFLELRDIPDELGRVGTTFEQQVPNKSQASSRVGCVPSFIGCCCRKAKCL